MEDAQGLRVYQKLESFASSRKASWVAFLWGVCEATFFFIVPDIFFCFTALFKPVRGIRHCIESVLGSIVGGAFMYALARTYPSALNGFLLKVPAISARMVELVHADFQQFGIKALFWAPGRGIPYKIFAVQAGILHVDFFKFIIATFPARLERILLLACVAAAVGAIAKQHIRRHPKGWLVIYLLIWGGFYYAYWFILRIK